MDVGEYLGECGTRWVEESVMSVKLISLSACLFVSPFSYVSILLSVYLSIDHYLSISLILTHKPHSNQVTGRPNYRNKPLIAHRHRPNYTSLAAIKPVHLQNGSELTSIAAITGNVSRQRNIDRRTQY